MPKTKIRKVSDNFDRWIRETGARNNLDGVEITRILGLRLEGVDIDEQEQQGKKKRRLKRTRRNMLDEFFRDDLI